MQKVLNWGNWFKEESSLHINVLEIATAYFAVKIYAATLTEISINLRVDNTAILAWIKEFAKLLVFRAYLLYVPTCLRSYVLCKPTFL